MPLRLALPEDMKEIAQIYVASWREIYSSLLPEEYLTELSPEEAEKKWRNYTVQKGNFVFLASGEKRDIQGFAAIQENSGFLGAGLLDSLHLRPNYRGRGIGKSLIAAGARKLREKGITRMVVWGLEGNDKALDIYRHLGAEFLAYKVHHFGDHPVREIAQIWRDTEELCSL
ncbi:MAG TPA: GNAT family N-acetyltransferase [Synergistaceae bacterium]|nr:GNAT family N-acetyltransferase [Synergistaceae bacterium]